MTTAGIGELKARLSAYVARVRAGEEVTITDRGRPVARIVPVPGSEPSAAELEELVRAGVVSIGSGRLPSDFRARARPADPEATVRNALVEERHLGR